MSLIIRQDERSLYRGLILDKFQEEAMTAIDNNQSVLVSAPTGVGKTLIADYTIEKCYREGKQVIYTAPIKALSNQKYKDFKNLFGEIAVGIITGDIVINSEAPILVMTTEIFRNMLLTKDQIIDAIDYIIFDEVHYISDADRGSVWEESIIFLPSHVKILGLSATIPNVDELAKWITTIRKEEVKIVHHFERAVPLQHYLFEKSMGLGNAKELLNNRQQKVKELTMEGWEEEDFSPKKSYYRSKINQGPKFTETTHIDLIEYIKRDYLPCLYFVFSRKQCEEKAFELARTQNFLNEEEGRLVQALLDAKLNNQVVRANQSAIERIRKVLLKGTGYHHAGMLPIVKDVVEELLAARLIKVLYCTETFAVGINMPVKSVCFDSNEKYDGKQFRLMTNQEYFQMAGRAGRRGIDIEGFVFTLTDLNFFDPDKIINPDEGKLENLRSQFNLSYNSVLNLIKNHQKEEEIFQVLQNNLAYFQNTREIQEYEEKLKIIESQLKTLVGKRCQDLFLATCPLQNKKMVQNLKQQKAELKRLTYGRHGKNNRHNEKQKKLANHIKYMEAVLNKANLKSCKTSKVNICRDERRLYQRLESEKNELIKSLSEARKGIAFVEDFKSKRNLMQQIGYVEGGSLTMKGDFASRVYVQELFVTELFFDGIFHEFDHGQLIALVAGIGYEGRKNEWFKKGEVYNLERIYEVLSPIIAMEGKVLKVSTLLFNPNVALMAYQWSNEEKFENMRNYTSLQDGDIVSVFRRTIDLLRQVRSAAAGDEFMKAKLGECIRLIDRDVVEVIL